MKVRSHYIPATKGVTERSAKQRNLIVMDRNGKPMFEPIKVVPNKALKVQEVIERFTRGLPVDTSSGPKPVWTKGSHDGPDYNKLSMMDPLEKADAARGMRFPKTKAPKEKGQQEPKVEEPKDPQNPKE